MSDYVSDGGWRDRDPLAGAADKLHEAARLMSDEQARTIDALESRLAVLERENAELRAGLTPFAAIRTPDSYGDDVPVWGYNSALVTHGDLRRAARLLAGEDTK